MATIVTRVAKGSPLTHVEVDTNFTNLNTAKLENLAAAAGAGTAAAPSISFAADVNTGLFNPAADTLAFAEGGAERMRIGSDGTVVVNATTTTYSPISFAVRGIVEQTIATFNNGNQFYLFLSGTQGSATYRGAIETNGVSVIYSTASDARLKENIQDSVDSGALIDAVQVRAFDWKETGIHQDYGFIAQELAQVYPQAVSSPLDDRLLGVDYGQLVPLLIKEIQSLRSRVAALETA